MAIAAQVVVAVTADDFPAPVWYVKAIHEIPMMLSVVFVLRVIMLGELVKAGTKSQV